MYLLTHISPPANGKYIVFGTTKERALYWVDRWETNTFDGLGKRKIMYWAEIDDNKFLSYPDNQPNKKGSYLVSGLRNGKRDIWVITWNHNRFNVYARQEVQSFQELPVI